jgi:hypothetical protein
MKIFPIREVILIITIGNRWRGENVSTLEVEAIISNIIGRTDATGLVAVP